MDKKETVKAIKRQFPNKIPVWYHYAADETKEKYGACMDELLQEFRDDMAMCFMEDQDWGVTEEHAPGGVGNQVKEPVITDWIYLPEYLGERADEQNILKGHFPDYKQGDLFGKAEIIKCEHPGEFAFGAWWRAFFERIHYLRNMENTFCDLLLERQAVELLLDKIEEYLKGIVDRFAAEVGVDGIFFGDDYGMQDRLMIHPDTFRDIFKPRLKHFIEYCHKKDLYVGMHTCGNIVSIIPDFIDIGLDILHPLQPHSVDCGYVVKEFGRDITFFAGVDVQYLLPSAKPEQIYDEIGNMFSLFGKTGGFLCTFANTIMPETPFENIEAAFRAIDYHSKNMY